MSPRRADPKLKKKDDGLPTWVTAVAIVVIVVVAVVALFWIQTPQPVAPASGGSTAASRTRGDPNAKIEMVEYADFQ